MSIQRFTKQPSDVLDYEFDFTDWFGARADTIGSYIVVVATGLTKVVDSMAGKIVTVVLSGGTSGVSYKVTVRITTTAATPLVKETDIIIKVKEI